MGAEKQDLINALNSNVKNLHQDIDMQGRLIISILEGQVDRRNLRRLLDLCPKRPREVAMESAIKDAIDVLEESRKAFKSKKLEVLRKKLTQLLIDT